MFVTGTGFAMCSAKESHDSDADLDVDGDDTLEYGKAQYPSLTALGYPTFPELDVSRRNQTVTR